MSDALPPWTSGQIGGIRGGEAVTSVPAFVFLFVFVLYLSLSLPPYSSGQIGRIAAGGSRHFCASHHQGAFGQKDQLNKVKLDKWGPL